MPVLSRGRWWHYALSAILPFAVSMPRRAHAEELRVHALAGFGHAIGNPQAREFGFGADGELALELPLATAIGVQAEVGGFFLSKGDPPEDSRFADHGTGTSFNAMLGIRVHPARIAGVWFDVNGGYDRTGPRDRAAFDAHLGYDWRLGDSHRSRWDLGPYVGYTQIFQPDDNVRPEDAHVAWIGLHVGLGGRAREEAVVRRDRDGDAVYDDEDACPDVAGIRTNDPKTNGCPRADRDKDTVFDDEDACPDVAGRRTNDPKTNGCPRADRDKDTVFDDEDACPDVAGVRTTDPKTNGCPRPDRDKDSVFDDEDACPDVPGTRTTDPKTNGCPPAGDQVHVEGDRILLDDVIHFDLGSPHVHRPSWKIIQKVADFVKATPDIEEIHIEGHADEIGSDDYNMRLSGQRAEAVKVILVKLGVDPKRLETKAWGKTHPRMLGHSENERRENRRVEFIITRASHSEPGGKTTP